MSHIFLYIICIYIYMGEACNIWSFRMWSILLTIMMSSSTNFLANAIVLVFFSGGKNSVVDYIFICCPL